MVCMLFISCDKKEDPFNPDIDNTTVDNTSNDSNCNLTDFFEYDWRVTSTSMNGSGGSDCNIYDYSDNASSSGYNIVYQFHNNGSYEQDNNGSNQWISWSYHTSGDYTRDENEITLCTLGTTIDGTYTPNDCSSQYVDCNSSGEICATNTYTHSGSSATITNSFYNNGCSIVSTSNLVINN